MSHRQLFAAAAAARCAAAPAWKLANARAAVEPPGSAAMRRKKAMMPTRVRTLRQRCRALTADGGPVHTCPARSWPQTVQRFLASPFAARSRPLTWR